MSPRREALTLLSLPVLLAAVAGRPSLAGLRSPDLLSPLLAVVGVLAWAAVSWLLLVLALTWCARDGRRLAVTGLRLIAPRSVRWAARAALGLTLSAAALTAAPALAAPVVPTPLDLDWTGALPTPTAAAAARPITRTPSTRPAPVMHPVVRRAPTTVVVRRGDSLWSIAARSLGPSASSRQIAQSWPRWWRTNASQIGSNPDLIHPGAVLLQPTTHGEP